MNNRREFFRKIGQLTMLTAMIGGSVYLLAENKVRFYGCTTTNLCRNCRKLASCRLDDAINYMKDEQ